MPTTTVVDPPGSSTSSEPRAPAATTTTGPTTSVAVADTTPPPTVAFVEPPTTVSPLAAVRADIGVAYPFVLSSRCGVGGMFFDQREWRNDPPLAEPGARPEGWNPSYEQGSMTLSSTDVAEFTSADGLRTARYVPRPPGSPDLASCA